MPIRPLRAGEEDTLYAFVGALNVPGRQLCLHLADRPDEVAADFADLDRPIVERCLVRDDGEGITGAIAWDIGGDDGSRCWLLGPWVDDPGDVEGMEALVRAVLDAHTPAARRVDNYIDESHPAGVRVHDALGFERRKTVHVLRVDRPAVEGREAIAPPAGIGIDALRPAWRDRIVELHEDAFPETHTAVDTMLTRPRDRVLVAHRAGAPVGYIHLHRPSALPEGRVEYIAVDASCRGQGIGRALLSAGVRWLVGDEQVPEVFLTVHADNRRALGVYHAAGFGAWRTGISLVLDRSVQSR